jgi:HD-like signal output (HDOD) protein
MSNLHVALIAAAAVILIVVVLVLLRRKPPAPPELRSTPPAKVVAPAPAPATPAAAPAAATPVPEAFRRVHALALNDPRAADGALKPDVAHMPLIMAASSAIAQIGTEPQYTPRRPSLLPQLLEAVNDEEASLRAMTRIISQDPKLTSDLLRTSNSALYRVSSTPIESIERAAAMIGTTGIRAIIAASLVQPLAAASGNGLGQFGEVMWEHSLYSATGAESLAARAQDCDPFSAHLLGLLHGLGSVAVYRVLVDLYAAQSQLKPDAVAIAQALDTSASVTARRIAANWGLSERTQEALESQSSAAPTGEAGPLSRALRFGRTIGAIVLLCRRGAMTLPEGRQQLSAAGYDSPQIDRIWDRMVRAYVTQG